MFLSYVRFHFCYSAPLHFMQQFDVICFSLVFAHSSFAWTSDTQLSFIKYMYIEINKDNNVIRNPNILNMKIQTDGTTRKKTTDQERKRERRRKREREEEWTENYWIEICRPLYFIYLFFQTVAIYPKAECALTTDARFQYTIMEYSVRLCVQHSLNYLSPTDDDDDYSDKEGEKEEKGMQQFNENVYTMHPHRKCHAVKNSNGSISIQCVCVCFRCCCYCCLVLCVMDSSQKDQH